jgi:hypothetical protein
MKKLTLSVAALTIAMLSVNYKLSAQTQCKEMTKDNIQCKNITKKANGLCHNHDKNHKIKSDSKTVICSGTTKKNTKCRRKTKHSSGKCHNHRK